MAPGYWLPSYYYVAENQNEHEKQSLLGYEIFKKWMKTMGGIFEFDVYEEMTDE